MRKELLKALFDAGFSFSDSGMIETTGGFMMRTESIMGMTLAEIEELIPAPNSDEIHRKIVADFNREVWIRATLDSGVLSIALGNGEEGIGPTLDESLAALYIKLAGSNDA